MTTYTTLADATLAQDKPLTQSVVRALRDNPSAIAEGDASAPIIVGVNPITSATASNSATLTFTNISAAFNILELELEGLVPVTTGTTLQMQFSTDNGSTWIAGTNNYYANSVNLSGATASAEGGVNVTTMALSKASDVLNSAAVGLSGLVKLFNLASTAKVKAATWQTFYGSSSGGFASVAGGGTAQTSATAINAVRLLFSSGNISTGRAVLRGRRKP